MNKHESKYFNTAKLMNEALTVLLEKKEYEFITIKEICALAGVNRSTFYLHYETIDGLLKETLENCLKSFYESFDEIYINKENKLNDKFFLTDEYFNGYLDFIRKNKKLFYLICQKPEIFDSFNIYDKMYKDIFVPAMNKYNVDKKIQEYIAFYYTSGIMSIIKMWLYKGCLLSNEELIDIINYCIDAKTLKEKSEKILVNRGSL